MRMIRIYSDFMPIPSGHRSKKADCPLYADDRRRSTTTRPLEIDRRLYAYVSYVQTGDPELLEGPTTTETRPSVYVLNNALFFVSSFWTIAYCRFNGRARRGRV